MSLVDLPTQRERSYIVTGGFAFAAAFSYSHFTLYNKHLLLKTTLSSLFPFTSSENQVHKSLFLQVS